MLQVLFLVFGTSRDSTCSRCYVISLNTDVGVLLGTGVVEVLIQVLSCCLIHVLRDIKRIHLQQVFWSVASYLYSGCCLCCSGVFGTS